MKLDEKDIKRCIGDLLPILGKHGYDVFKRAANKLITDRRDAEKLRALIKQKENELADLRARNPDVFEEAKARKKDHAMHGGIETLADV
jgi:hypothetical protein